MNRPKSRIFGFGFSRKGKGDKEASVGDATDVGFVENWTEGRDKFGLFPLHRDYHYPYPPRKTPIDIIAVHGTVGDAFNTWGRVRDTLWLRDFLPYDIPGAYIFTYGYNTTVFFSKSTAGYEESARKLLEYINQSRIDKVKGRKIIFLCHSLGGAIVKKALTIARLEYTHFKDINNSCIGIIFLATPHRPSREVDWSKFSANIVDLGSPSFSGKSRTGLRKKLERNEAELEKISSEFADQKLDIHIASFIEQKITPPASVIIVGSASAVMEVPDERVIAMQGCDHRSICRFDDNDDNYHLILGVIKDWAYEAGVAS